MKAATQALRDSLTKSVAITATPKARAEWEHNRYSPIDTLIVSPSNPDTDPEWNGVYDLDSISLPNRPKTGIAKARLSEPILAQSSYRDTPQSSRFYAAADNDIYKYWSSWSRTKLSPVATQNYEFPDPIVITLTYKEEVISNKIVLGFDLSYAKPRSYDLEINENGTWSRIARDIIPTSDGQVVLYRKSDGSGSWDTSAVYDAPTYVKALRLTVRSMTEGYANLDVIQLGARLENDLSDFIVSYSKQMELSQRSFIAPLGQASSNEGTIVLSNFDYRFNNENEDSIYYGLIDKKVKFTIDLSIDATDTNGSVDERVRELTMYADSWGGQDQDTVTVELKDSSVFLQEINMPKTFWENMTIGAIIWQIMDTVGLTNYAYIRDVLDTGQLIPYFWCDEGTAWDQISNLAEGTQTAVYFDEWDIMQIRTRKAMFGNGNKTINWNLDAVKVGSKLPDIIDLSGEDDLVANDVTINWKPAQFSDFNNGLPKMETAWEPEDDTVVLRATALTRDLKVDSVDLWINHSETAYWPYAAMINIRGEILSYNGKEYTWYKPGGGVGYEIVKSLEDQKKVDDKSDPNMVWANNWTGRLMVDKRGLGSTPVVDHVVKPSKYQKTATAWNNNMFYPISDSQGGMYYNDGFITLQPPFAAGDYDYFLIKNDEQISAHPNATYGTRFRFPSANLRPDIMTAGIWIDGDWGDAGYYIEISPSVTVESEGRAFHNEIRLIRMPGNAPAVPTAGLNGNDEGVKGYQANILTDTWYDLDVTHKVQSNGDAQIVAFLNGVYAAEWVVPGALRPSVLPGANGGDFGHTGLFTRGAAKCDFEYLYAMNHQGDERNPNDLGTWVAEPDESSFLDLTTGSFSSGFIQREFRYGYYWSLNRGPSHEGGYWFGPVLYSWGSYFLDEFGPVVHELREFDINFSDDKVPVGHSYLYLSNSSQVVCTDYYADAFGAKFTLVNASRRDAIVKGEDKITAGEDNSIDQKLFVYGRTLYQEDENELVKKDEQSIRRKGSVSLEFDNKHIQTQSAADDLGQWVIDLWGSGADEVSVELFGNPLLQLGDLVTVNYPAKGMDPSTHLYYVVQVQGEHDQGYSTKMIMRRARNIS